MIFKCRSCGGNVVYDPERRKMYCPHCGGEDTQEREAGGEAKVCASCGAPLEAGEFRSAVKCEYCGNYTILDGRVEGGYRPRYLLPFRLGREKAAGRLREEFKRRVFAPDSFLSEAQTLRMEGIYVPFWLYDMSADCSYAGTGTRVRVWRSGDTEYTETSYFQVYRDMDVEFEKIPIDASIEMPDELMGLVEPYQYGELSDFAPEYMSGFLGEVYQQTAQELEGRATDRAGADAASLLHETLAGYTTMLPQQETIQVKRQEASYALLPVWRYHYRYRGKDYDCYVNGQTGKTVGKAPLSRLCIAVYGGTFFACMTAILCLARAILEAL